MSLDKKIALASAVGSALAGIGALAVVLFMFFQFTSDREERQFERAARKWALRTRASLLIITQAARMPGLAMIEVSEKEIEFALWSAQKGFLQIAPNTRQLSVMLPCNLLTRS